MQTNTLRGVLEARYYREMIYHDQAESYCVYNRALRGLLSGEMGVTYSLSVRISCTTLRVLYSGLIPTDRMMALICHIMKITCATDTKLQRKKYQLSVYFEASVDWNEETGYVDMMKSKLFATFIWYRPKLIDLGASALSASLTTKS